MLLYDLLTAAKHVNARRLEDPAQTEPPHLPSVSNIVPTIAYTALRGREFRHFHAFHNYLSPGFVLLN